MKQVFRPATPDDLEYIVDLGVNLSAKHGDAYRVPADALSVAQEVSHAIQCGVCLVGNGCAAGGYVKPFIWGHDIKVGMVTFWNFTTPSGVHILGALVDEFAKRGATFISAASHFPHNRVGDLYARMGMWPAETTYVGEIATMKKLVA